MKNTFPFLFGASILVFFAFTGCDKKDSASVSVTTTNSVVEQATSDIKNAATNAGEKIKETTEKAGAATKDEVKNLADKFHTDTATPAATPPEVTISATNSPAAAQGLIDKAKAYVSEGKYKESLTSLKQLSDYQLTPEQQKTVDDLKARAQKYFATNTLKSLSGLFQRTNVPTTTNP